MGKDKKLEHIAIIMDGNGRWAKKRGLSRIEGHREGAKNVKRIAEACIKYGVKYLTLYAFSTENWKRPKREVNALMRLLSNFIREEKEELLKDNIRILVSGEIEQLPGYLKKDIKNIIKESAKNERLIINIALNYGARYEILRAVKNIIKDVKNKKLKLERLNEQIFSNYLYNGDILPEPDFLIRTSGELRISNFLLWQIAYTEFYFTKTLWPDFDGKKLKRAIDRYYKRDRRFGGIEEK